MTDEQVLPETPYQRLKREQQDREQLRTDVQADLAELRTVKVAAAQDAEERKRGHIKDSVVGASRAVPGFFEETFDFIASFDEWMMGEAVYLQKKAGIPDVRLDVNPFDGNDRIGFFTVDDYDKDPLQSMFRPSERGLAMITDSMPEPERISGQFVEAAGKFAMGFMTGRVAFQAAGVLQGSARTAQVANMMASGAFGDVLGFDGHEARLSNLIEASKSEGGFPDISNPLTEWLQADEADSELEGRAKAALEGAGLGALADVIMLGGKALWKLKGQRAVAQAVEQARAAEFKVTEEALKPAKVAADEADAARAADDTVTKADETAKADDAQAEVKISAEEAKEILGARTRVAMDLDPEQIIALRRAMGEGDDNSVSRVLNDFNTEKFDWDKIEGADDIYSVIRSTEEVFSEIIDDVKGGVQSVKYTEMMARLTGASAEQVKRLFDDVRGDKGIAVRFMAGHRVMLASAKELKARAKQALKSGSNIDEAAYMQHAQVHVALQSRLKGVQTEIARTMRMMREVRDGVASEFRELDEIRAQFGGGRGSDAFNDHLNKLIQMGDVTQINRHVAETMGQKFKNMFIEYTLNSLLSSLKTHAINITSNVLNTVMWTMDRLAANGFRAALGDQAAWREIRIDLHHKVAELPAAFRLAMQAFREGLPVTDMRQRLEFDNRRAITAANMGLSDDQWLGKAVNFAGAVIRMPGRALVTSDEFFKAWTGRSELQVQAFRQADKEAAEKGLQIGTPKYESFVEKRIVQLADPENNSFQAVRVREAARDRARMVTFQENAFTQKIGPAFENALNSSALIKLVVAPFYRTPMNILRQGLIDRTPLALTIKRHRDTIRAGGRDADEAIARIVTGTGAITGLWMFMDKAGDEKGSIEIIGKLPYESSARAAGVKDYSIRIGDTWYQYNRLDPLGLWLGMVADAHTIANQDEAAAGDYLQAASAAFLQNVVNKTWARSLSDLIETVEKIDGGRPATIERAWKEFLAGEAGKLIPQLVKSARDLEGERTAVETWGFYDNLAEMIPSLNKDLPPKHDALGRPITWKSGFGSMVNPFATSPGDLSPIDKEMFRLGFTVRPMRKTYGVLELTDKEYSKLTGMVNDFGLIEAMDALITAPEYNDMSDGLKAQVLKNMITKARESARLVFSSDPDFVKRLNTEEMRGINDLLSPSEDD